MMLSCKEAARLVSESLDHRLTFRQRLALGAHLLMCRFCSRYKSQTLLVREAVRQMAREEEVSLAGVDMSLTPAARERIKATIGNQIDSK